MESIVMQSRTVADEPVPAGAVSSSRPGQANQGSIPAPHALRQGAHLALIGAWLVWLAILLVLLWAANKSIAMQDEGSLLLGYRFPAETISSPRHFSLLIDAAFGWAHPGIVGYRLLKIALDTLASAALALGLASALPTLWSAVPGRLRLVQPGAGSVMSPHLYVRWATLFPYLATANAFGYGMFGQTVSYNSLNADALMASTGLLLGAAATRTKRLQYSLYGAAGLVLGLDLFVKFSSSLAFLAVAAMLLAMAGRGWRAFALRAGLLAGGYAAGLGLFFALILDPHTWLVNFRANVAAQAVSSHDPSQLFGSLAASIAALLPIVVIQALLCAAIFRVVGRTGAVASSVQRILNASMRGAILLGIAATSVYLTVQPCQGGWGTVAGFAMVIGTVLGAALAPANRLKPSWAWVRMRLPMLAVLSVLLVTPLIGVLGSNVPPLAAAGIYMPFWLAALVLLLGMVARAPAPRGVVAFSCCLPLVLIAAVVVQGLLLHPFGNPVSLFAQTETVAQAGDAGGLRVDPATAQFFRTVRRLVSADPSFHPGAPIISAYDLPGLIYVLGGVEPGASWYFADEPQQRLNCVELRSTHRHDLNKAIILAMPAVRPSFARCLRSVGIMYPAQYRLVGTVRNPYDGRVLHVFIPAAALQHAAT